MIYASSVEQFKRAFDLQASLHADSLEELEWEVALNEVSGGQT